jgi:hypothetical protein
MQQRGIDADQFVNFAQPADRRGEGGFAGVVRGDDSRECHADHVG